MFSSLTFSLWHQHICLCKGMSTEVIPLYNLNLILTLFNVLCLCDTLYFKGDEGKIKRDCIHRYWGRKRCNPFVLCYFNFRHWTSPYFENDLKHKMLKNKATNTPMFRTLFWLWFNHDPQVADGTHQTSTSWLRTWRIFPTVDRIRIRKRETKPQM